MLDLSRVNFQMSKLQACWLSEARRALSCNHYIVCTVFDRRWCNHCESQPVKMVESEAVKLCCKSFTHCRSTDLLQCQVDKVLSGCHPQWSAERLQSAPAASRQSLRASAKTIVQRGLEETRVIFEENLQKLHLKTLVNLTLDKLSQLWFCCFSFTNFTNMSRQGPCPKTIND